MTPTVRFAPSPTGRLHMGNIRPALMNWLFARHAGGCFILRLDDTDVERSTAAFADGIKTDLSWLGLTWDRLETQSSRFGRYAEVVEQLKRAGRLYACYETPDELDRRRKRQLARGAPPVYDRAALQLTDAERAKLESDGRKPHWRFKLDSGGPSAIATWDDLIRGPQHIDLASLSDPVLIREDGGYLYTLASVIDDIDMGITQVVRGEDHVTNTAVQAGIFRALGATPPAFAHHSLLVGADGEALSKRLDSLSVASFREAGLEPLAILSYLASIGTSDPVAPAESVASLARQFDFAKIGRAPVRFDVEELKALNARLLHQTPYAAVAPRLIARGITGAEPFWLAARANLALLADADIWWQVAAGDITPVIEDASFCKAAAELLPPEPWDLDTWGQWTNAIKAATGAKGKALFHPLRLALTGREHGPELKALLPLIGRARALTRLTAAG